MKTPLSDITNLNGSGLGVINNNSKKISDEFGKVLYTDGSVDMDGPLDMDSNRIINLPRAVSPSSPVTLEQFQTEKKGDRGLPGLPGVGGNTFVTLESIKTSTPALYASAILAHPSGSDSGYANGNFTYQLGDFTGRTDVIALNTVPVSVGAYVREEAKSINYGKTNLLLPLDKSLPRTLGYMGVDPFTTASQTSKLASAFANAAADGLKLSGHADARYSKEGPLSIASDFDGNGASFVGTGVSNAIQLSGSNKVWKNFTNLGASLTRTSADSTDGGFYVTATDFQIENLEAGRVEAGKGHGAAALFFAGAKRGRIRNTRAFYSHADGHHCSDGCEDLSFENPYSLGVGDDGFAVVAYDYQGKINKRIHTSNLRAIDVKARGLSVLGCLDSVHTNPTVIRSSNAAVYLLSEGTDSFNTLGSRGARVENLYAENCVTAVDRPGLSQAIILVGGRDGSVTLSDGTIEPLSVRDFFISGRIAGAGVAASYGIDSDSAFNLRGGYDLLLENISGPMTTEACVRLGGQDSYGRISIDGCDGYPFLFMPSATGDHSYEVLQAVGTRRKSTTIAEAVHGSSTNSWSNIHVDLLKFPDVGLTPAGNMDLSKFTWRRFIVAGSVIVHP